MRVHSFLNKCFRITCIIIVGIIFILNLFHTSEVGYDANEMVTIRTHFLKGGLLVLVSGIIIYCVSFFRGQLEKAKAPILIGVLSVIYVLLGLFLICNVDHNLREDALLTSQAAKDFLAGSRTMFIKGAYISKYPHQVGLMLYDALLYCFCDKVVINFLANLGFVLGINYYIYKISDLIFHNSLVNNISIILSFGFCPQFFFILFAYGTIPGLFFLIFAFYHSLCFVRNQKCTNLIIAVISSCIAVALRKNFLIGIFAIIIYLFIELLKKYSHKYLLFIACMIVSLVLPLRIMPGIFMEHATGMPSVLWVAMGTDIANRNPGPGWYDNSNNDIFFSVDYDYQLAQEKGNEKLKDNYKKIIEAPLSAGSFLKDKIVSQWCDPLCQSVWSGPLNAYNQHTNTALLKSIYSGCTAEDIIAYAMKIYMIIFWSACLVFLIKHPQMPRGWELPFLFFVGGFIFHIFWEGKSQYIYPYFLVLLPIVAFSLARILQRNSFSCNLHFI